jgi:hypothetical protein
MAYRQPEVERLQERSLRTGNFFVEKTARRGRGILLSRSPDIHALGETTRKPRRSRMSAKERRHSQAFRVSGLESRVLLSQTRNPGPETRNEHTSIRRDRLPVNNPGYGCAAGSEPQLSTSVQLGALNAMQAERRSAAVSPDTPDIRLHAICPFSEH